MMNTDAPDVADDSAGGNSGITPKLDATLDLLSNQRRRYVLYYLREEGGAVSVEEIADRVSSWEDEPTDSERVLADLHHSQLPRLDEADVVSFDPESGFVTLSANDDTPVGEYLELAAREENVV